jgi:cytochrome o ubiquinol oxidase subunit 3
VSEVAYPAATEALRHGPGDDPHRLGHGGGPGTGHGASGPASKRIIVGYGFWIFLLSDIVMFACFFAVFAVQRGATAGGPGMRELVELPRVAAQTAALLLSSYACGLSFAAANARNLLWTQVLMIVTGLLGLVFVGLELQEFLGLAARGIVPQRSGFLTAFFGLVGLHGVHMTLAGVWLATMVAQVQVKGFRPEIMHRLLCFNLFWHALDIVWIGIFSIVYLMGVAG